MPNIVSLAYGPEPVQEAVVDSPTYTYTRTVDGPVRALLVLSDGRQFRLTKDDVLAIYAQQKGSAQLRRAKTIQAILDQATAALGEMMDFDLDVDVDVATGEVTRLNPRARA